MSVFALYLIVAASLTAPGDQAPLVLAEARAPEDQTPTGKFTSAAEIKPIMEATRGQWIAVREWEGEDWIYFTQMMSWRCGLWEVRYGINGAPAETVLPMEPCYDETAAPNAFVDDALLPFVTFPLASVESVTVEVLYDDGTTDKATYERSDVLLP